jgi:hypothetical protein
LALPKLTTAVNTRLPGQKTGKLFKPKQKPETQSFRLFGFVPAHWENPMKIRISFPTGSHQKKPYHFFFNLRTNVNLLIFINLIILAKKVGATKFQWAVIHLA